MAKRDGASANLQQRLVCLDAMRGIAAVLVLIHHDARTLGAVDMLPAGFLSVDFFFLLSGFVVARAYETKLGLGLGGVAFLGLRMRRLLPVMWLGIVAGAVEIIFAGFGLSEAALRLLAQLLFIPILAGATSFFPLNGVQWSLLFELAANAVHGSILWKRPVMSLVALCATAFALFAAVTCYFGTAGVGDTGATIWAGIPRVFFSYTLGVLLYRLWVRGDLPNFSLGTRVTALSLPALLIVSGLVRHLNPPIVDLATILIFPLLLISGLNAADAGHLEVFCRKLGLLSYPLYAIHLPVLYAGRIVIDHHFATQGLPMIVLGAATAVACAMFIAHTVESPAARLAWEGRMNWLLARGRPAVT